MTHFEKITGSSAHAGLPAKFAIIVGGGAGTRAGGDIPKQFVDVDGVPVISYSLRAFKDADPQTVVIVVLPGEYADFWRSINRTLSENTSTSPYAVDHYFTFGGKTRTESVRNGLEVVAGLIDRERMDDVSGVMVAVHDGARPYLKPGMIEAGWDACMQSGGAVPVVPVVDSLRKITDNGGSESVDRAGFRAVQTPQVFSFPLLKEAYDRYGNLSGFTDDASLVEMLCPVALYDGDPDNQKVTTPRDLQLARLLLRRK